MGVGHGKVILLGEHAVVHGKPALALALAKGCRVQALPAERPSLHVTPWNVSVEPEQRQDDPQAELLRRAFAAILAAYRPPVRLRLEAHFEIPTGAGLGGSAALSVGIVRTLDESLGIERQLDDVIELSLAAERVFHGNPSGIDNAMAASGGAALYTKQAGLTPIALDALPLFVVGDSGQAGSTKAMVQSVARQLAASPTKVGKIFDGIEAVVNNGVSALKAGEWSRLGQLMELNQKLLNSLMLSTARLEELCNAAKQAGAMGAKLTGGGGGGCMIALCGEADQAAAVVDALRQMDSQAFVAEMGT